MAKWKEETILYQCIFADDVRILYYENHRR
jgi:hypothetical protein